MKLQERVESDPATGDGNENIAIQRTLTGLQRCAMFLAAPKFVGLARPISDRVGRPHVSLLGLVGV